MTHSSGIGVTEELEQAFAQARDEATNQDRFLKIKINEDRLVLDAKHMLSEDLAADFKAMAQYITAPTEACYFAFRLDSKNEFGFEWLLVSFVPDLCKVKEKMLYASTLDNLRKQLGAQYFTGDLHATLTTELTIAALTTIRQKSRRDLEDIQSAASDQEKLLQKEVDAGNTISVSSKNVHGVRFGMDDNAADALNNLVSQSVNFVSLAIDMSTEKIILDKSEASQTGDDLASLISDSEPRFSVFVFDHSNKDGAEAKATFFIYTCPDKSKIKERMIYSTTKSTVADALKALGIENLKAIETTDIAELNSQFLFNVLYPQAVEKKTFKKPTRATGSRGAARLVTKADQ